MLRFFMLWIGTLLLAACGAQDTARSAATAQPSPAQIRYADTATPVNTALAAKYDRSCRACHALPASGAPLTGHAQAWAPRLAERGMDGLLEATRRGLNAMPPMGLCPDCTDDELRALIDFMRQEGEA